MVLFQCVSARAAFIRLAMPDADFPKCPRLVFTEPIAQGLVYHGRRAVRRRAIGLNRIAKRSAGALRLDILHPARRDLRSGVCLAQDLLLRQLLGWER